jgi:hypothetical protein
VSGVYKDSAISVEVRLSAPVADRHVNLGCRYQEDGNRARYYQATLLPSFRRLTLNRWEDGKATLLDQVGADSSIQPGDAPNRLELRCVGSRITASVGDAVVSADDGTYSEGQHFFGVAMTSGVDGTIEGHVDNLVIDVGSTDLAASRIAIPKPTASPAPGVPPVPSPIPTGKSFKEYFDGPAGALPRSSPQESEYTLAYRDREYVIATVKPKLGYVPTVYVRDPADPAAVVEYADSTIEADVRFVSDVTHFAELGCRAKQPGMKISDYRARLVPGVRQVQLHRFEAGNDTLLKWRSNPAINSGSESNHFVLSCIGNTISAWVKSSSGQVVGVSVNDSTHRVGQHSIDAGVFSDADGLAEVHFDNLEVQVARP